MEINQFNINVFLNKYINFVDLLSNRFNYDNNIRHVLYIIVPAFIVKYGIINERKILSIFENVEILISDVEDNNHIASFNRKIIKISNDYQIKKKIVLIKYNKILLVDLVDSLIHEFNHAINSINNELKVNDDIVYLRSGLAYTCYSKENLKKNATTSNIIILEEILNTLQTEEIIKIILSFKKYDINNNEISNTIYSLNNELSHKFMSKAYFLETFVIRKLAQNITFISTLQKMRFSGYEIEVESWFDGICGIKGSLNNLCNKLEQLQLLEQGLIKNKIFKKWITNKIIIKFKEIENITRQFSDNCIYK